MIHTCHADGCSRVVPRAMLMCRVHWFAVPPPLRLKVWKTFTPGQCDDPRLVTKEYLEAARDAVIAVARREPRRAAP